MYRTVLGTLKMDCKVVCCVLFGALCWINSAGAVNPACLCVRYESESNKVQRMFMSPNFPTPYRADIDCILFTFVGDAGEIVEIDFEKFDLQPADNGSCKSGDFVRIYDNLPRDEINNWSSYNYELCGSFNDLPQRTFFSANRALTFEFHTTSGTSKNHTGFKGNFSFLPKKDYLMAPNAQVPFGSQCTWMIESEKIDSRHPLKLFSPHYPQNYPAQSSCQYYFIGKSGEKVEIVFNDINLHKAENSRCGSQNSDYIRVRDGGDGNAPVIKTLCNLNKSKFRSSRSSLFVEFVSNGENQAKGFDATYKFFTENDLPTVFDNGTGNCNQLITSIESRSGTVASPSGYPGWNRIHECTYKFIGSGRERVQIMFEEFDLYFAPQIGYPHDPVESSRCGKNDHISAMVMSDGQEILLNRFCGTRIPPSLMSSDFQMSLVLTGGLSKRMYPSVDVAQGFRLKYKFVTNFGIGVGEQISNHECAFKFVSDVSSSGNFSSPNYPGMYPKDTECQYVFYGRKGEIVIIHFFHFDVEGLSLCGQEDDDYVEFSNFDTPDRKMDRYCGTKKQPPQYVVSDSSYFRVIFKSNGVYEQTGFLATYQFRLHKAQPTVRMSRSRATGLTMETRSEAVFIAVMLYIIVVTLIS